MLRRSLSECMRLMNFIAVTGSGDEVGMPSIEPPASLVLVSGKKALFTGLFDGDSDEVRFDRSGSFLARLEQIVEPVQVPDLPENRDGAEDTDAADREVDGMVGAAGESQDVVAAGAAAPSAQVVSAPAAVLPSAAEVKSLFSALEIRRTERGGISIEAPPEAAATLAAGSRLTLNGASLGFMRIKRRPEGQSAYRSTKTR